MRATRHPLHGAHERLCRITQLFVTIGRVEDGAAGMPTKTTAFVSAPSGGKHLSLPWRGPNCGESEALVRAAAASVCPNLLEHGAERFEPVDRRVGAGLLQRGTRMLAPGHADPRRASGAPHRDIVDRVADHDGIARCDAGF